MISKLKLNQKGAGLQFLIVILLIISVIAGYFFLNQKFIEKPDITSPSPSSFPPSKSSQPQKLEEYDKNKEEIKAKLNLSEQEFQILKRYSAD